MELINQLYALDATSQGLITPDTQLRGGSVEPRVDLGSVKNRGIHNSTGN